MMCARSASETTFDKSPRSAGGVVSGVILACRGRAITDDTDDCADAQYPFVRLENKRKCRLVHQPMIAHVIVPAACAVSGPKSAGTGEGAVAETNEKIPPFQCTTIGERNEIFLWVELRDPW